MARGSTEPQILGEAATEALAEIAEAGVEQGAFEGMEEVVKIRFAGMAYDSVEDTIGLGDERVFTVRARCIESSTALMHDGVERKLRKMEVQSIVVVA